jgi:hypothetical protein
MKMKKIIAPICLLHNGSYVAPGTEVELPEDEADSLTSRFGQSDGPVLLTTADLESVNSLNANRALFEKK